MCHSALIVSNNQLERRIVSKCLKENIKKLEEIKEAVTLEEALELLETFSPELIVQDMSNLSQSVFQVVTKARKKYSNLIVIITSATNESDVLATVLKAGANGYLLKPYSPESLLKIVQEAIIKKDKNSDEENADLREKIKNHMIESFRCHKYKKSINIAKEYIDSFFDYEDNETMQFTKTFEFLEILSQIEQEYGNAFHPVNRNKCEDRYSAYLEAEEYIQRIHNLLDKEYIYRDDMNKALNYIDINMKKGISLEDVADYINVSTCYFSKLFKKSTGTNFISYVTEGRIEMAKEMLNYTQMPVVNIAYELSYTETNYFSKAFKKYMGMSPTEYRQQCVAEHKKH